MSSIPNVFTGTRFKKNPFDYYETPQDLAYKCISRMPMTPANTKSILDVGFGKGIWGTAARMIYPRAYLTGVDIQDFPHDVVYHETHRNTDYLTFNTGNTYDLIIGNPPYSSQANSHLAEDMVLHSLTLLNDNGYLGFLLKTEFKASFRRFINIFSTHAPVLEYQLVQRPNWTNYKKGSNTIEYSFFIWKKQSNYETITRWLNWR